VRSLDNAQGDDVRGMKQIVKDKEHRLEMVATDHRPNFET
jgi:hypothetical protein